MKPGKVITVEDFSVVRRITEWQFCPICGTARPEEKKSLAKKLYEAFPAKHPHNDVFEHLANVAKEHFFDNCEEELQRIIVKEAFDRHNYNGPYLEHSKAVESFDWKNITKTGIKFLRER